MTSVAGLLIGGVSGATLTIILMAALELAGQSDQCSECLARQRLRQMAYDRLADDGVADDGVADDGQEVL